jgi:4-hydroxy-2-oxoheptanedioate aldolase
MAPPSFKPRLDAGEVLYSAWVTMPCADIAGALARHGWDAVVIDMQHGYGDFADMRDGIGQIAAAGAAPVVRVGIREDALIGRAADSGALGLICPMVNSPAEAASFARASKYPPIGQRSWAPMRALDVLGMDRQSYLNGANDLVTGFAMVETAQALENLDAICATPGIDGIFVGPNDLSVSLSKGAAADPARADVRDALAHVAKKCGEAGLAPGIFANTPEMARAYREMDYRFIAVASDSKYLEAGSRGMLEAARGR